MQPPLHLVALAAQEAERLADQQVVFLGGDLAGAWRATALDLEQETRPEPRFEVSVGAGTE
jgi:hypothetical protein